MKRLMAMALFALTTAFLPAVAAVSISADEVQVPFPEADFQAPNDVETHRRKKEFLSFDFDEYIFTEMSRPKTKAELCQSIVSKPLADEPDYVVVTEVKSPVFGSLVMGFMFVLYSRRRHSDE